jgi:DNA repair ATPase RecN
MSLSSFWSEHEKRKQLDKVEGLANQIEKLEKTLPGLEEEWKKADEKVLALARDLSAALLTANPDRILHGKEAVSTAITDRDSPRRELQRRIDEVRGQIKEINSPFINLQVDTWRRLLKEVPRGKIFQKTNEAFNHEKFTKVISFNSNLPTIQKAVEMLLGAIKTLQGMGDSRLSSVFTFIEATEVGLKSLDFRQLEKMDPVHEKVYLEMLKGPEVTEVPVTAFLEPLLTPGERKIRKLLQADPAKYVPPAE